VSFREKKQNSNRVKGVGVLSILAKVKKCKKVIFSPYCINGLIRKSTVKCIDILDFIQALLS
jgi:hypothetical protein